MYVRKYIYMHVCVCFIYFFRFVAKSIKKKGEKRKKERNVDCVVLGEGVEGSLRGGSGKLSS